MRSPSAPQPTAETPRQNRILRRTGFVDLVLLAPSSPATHAACDSTPPPRSAVVAAAAPPRGKCSRLHSTWAARLRGRCLWSKKKREICKKGRPARGFVRCNPGPMGCLQNSDSWCHFGHHVFCSLVLSLVLHKIAAGTGLYYETQSCAKCKD